MHPVVVINWPRPLILSSQGARDTYIPIHTHPGSKRRVEELSHPPSQQQLEDRSSVVLPSRESTWREPQPWQDSRDLGRTSSIGGASGPSGLVHAHLDELVTPRPGEKPTPSPKLHPNPKSNPCLGLSPSPSPNPSPNQSLSSSPSLSRSRSRSQTLCMSLSRTLCMGLSLSVWCLGCGLGCDLLRGTP